jgi:fumarylacetoacetate (FAA) hydrolase family protein
MQSFLKATLPADAQQATLVGRVWIEGQGPVLVRADHQSLYDLSSLAPTCSALLELPDPAAAVRKPSGAAHRGGRDVIANSSADARVDETPWLLAPCDLQASRLRGHLSWRPCWSGSSRSRRAATRRWPNRCARKWWP